MAEAIWIDRYSAHTLHTVYMYIHVHTNQHLSVKLMSTFISCATSSYACTIDIYMYICIYMSV